MLVPATLTDWFALLPSASNSAGPKVQSFFVVLHQQQVDAHKGGEELLLDWSLHHK